MDTCRAPVQTCRCQGPMLLTCFAFVLWNQLLLIVLLLSFPRLAAARATAAHILLQPCFHHSPNPSLCTPVPPSQSHICPAVPP